MNAMRPFPDRLDQEIASLGRPPQSALMGAMAQGQPMQFIRGQDGRIAGAKIGAMTFAFVRGPDGQIAGARLMNTRNTLNGS